MVFHVAFIEAERKLEGSSLEAAEIIELFEGARVVDEDAEWREVTPEAKIALERMRLCLR